jgi:phospholipid/cholesterol/gamma-HCH transport system substrate-binding protein
MEPEARYTAIGAALLVLLVALAASAVWLTGSGTRADSRHYTIYFERQSLQGLQVGSAVEMRGIQIGRVTRFAISRDNINRVEVTIRVAGSTPVSTNTVAVVERKILTGLARISLETPGTPGPELSATGPGAEYPVIAEGHSDTEEITDAMSRLAITATSALENVNQLLTEENRKELFATLASLRTMSGSVAKAATDLGKSGRDIAAVAEKASAAAEPVATQASATLRDVSRAAEALERAADVSVNELRATAQELRANAATAARTAERLDDPRALLFGPSQQQLGPGERLP